MNRSTAPPPRHTSRHLAAVLVGLLIAGLSAVLPARPAWAAPALDVTITPAATTVRSHSRIPFSIGYAVTGETLTSGRIRVALPGDRWTSSDLRLIGGVSHSFAADGDTIVATWNLGDVPGGTTGTVELEARTLHTVLPHGTVVSLDAELSGTNAPAVTTATPATVTLEAIATAAIFLDDQGALAASGPAGTPVAGQPGFEVRYRVQPRAICDTFTDEAYPEECLPVVGQLTSTMPANAWLARVEPVRPTPAELAEWNDLAPDTPWDLSAVPTALGPGGVLSIPIRAHHWRVYPDGNGDISQASILEPPCPCPPSIFDHTRPPELEVVLWVPATVAPINLVTGFTVTGDNGRGGTTTATGARPVLVTNDNELHLEKFTPGCGPLLVAGNRPFNSCVLPYNGTKEYWTDVTTVGSVVDPVITDVLPAEVEFIDNRPPPAPWIISYSTLAGCSAATPDAAFTAAPPAAAATVRCIRWRYSGVFAGLARLVINTRRNPSVVLASGEHMLTTNRVYGTGANVQPVSAERPQWLWNFWDAVTSKFAPNLVEPGEEFSYQIFAVDARAYGTVGPRDYTVRDTLSPDLTYLGHTILSRPPAPGGGFLPVTCGFTPATREFRCDAPGQAADSEVPVELFRVDVHVRVADPISTTTIFNTVCGWADSLEGPLDELGAPLTWSTNRFAPSCNTARSDVRAVPVVSNNKVLTSPAAGPVSPGQLVSYRIDYGHVLPQSTADIVDGYIYDFPGRDPFDGSPEGVLPTIVSAAAGGDEHLEYTCSSGASRTVAALTWTSSPCAGITAVRWQLTSTDVAAPAGTYRRTDPPGSVTLTVQVPAEAPHGAQLVNRSVIVGAGMSPAASAPVETVVDRPVDLAIDKTHPAGFGETAGWVGTWNVSVANNGTHAALPSETVTVTDTLPASVTLLSAGGPGWACTPAVPLVTCTRPGPVAAGATLPPIVIQVRAPAGTHTNSATVTTTAHDTNPPNDTDTDTVTVRPIVTARAWGLRTELPLLGNLALGDTGEVSARGDRHVDEHILRREVGNILTAVVLAGVVDISDGPAGGGPWAGEAVGTVDRVALTVGGVRIVAEDLVATSHSECGTRTQSASIARLVVNNQDINVAAPAPNTVINAGLVKITLNERVGGAVTALRIQVAGLVDLRVAYARSAVDCG